MAVVGTSPAPVIGRSGGLGWDQPELPWSGQQENVSAGPHSAEWSSFSLPTKTGGTDTLGVTDREDKWLSRGLGVTVAPDISRAAQGHHITPAGAGLQRRLQQRHVKVMCILCTPQGWRPRGAAGCVGGDLPWVTTCREGEGAGWGTAAAPWLPAPELSAGREGEVLSQETWPRALPQHQQAPGTAAASPAFGWDEGHRALA